MREGKEKSNDLGRKRKKGLMREAKKKIKEE
jgi:hypothetical protein